MTITKRNHYNPCFWTAYWNYEYFNNKIEKKDIYQKPREQLVYSLNLKSNEIIIQKTEKVFFEKGAGLADLSKDDVLKYCQKNQPEKYEEMVEYFEKEPSAVLIDFENHFTEFENLYKSVLENTIIHASIPDISIKTSLSYFLLIQLIRNHYTLNQTISQYEFLGKAKFEVFMDIKNAVSDSDHLLKLIMPFLSSKWTLYKTRRYKFPLSYNPVLIRPFHIMIALAPNLMLEIDLKQKVSVEEICEHKDIMPFHKYAEFKKRTIENSSREIIFGNDQLLLIWKKTKTYKDHLSRIKNAR